MFLSSVDPSHVAVLSTLTICSVRVLVYTLTRLEMSTALESLLEMGFPKNKAYVDRRW